MAKVYRDPRMQGSDGKPALCIRFKGLDGKYHKERTNATGRDVAEVLLRQRLNEIETARSKGLQDLQHLKPTTFGTFYSEKYLPSVKERISASTYLRKEMAARYVLPFFGSIPLKALNAGHVSEYMSLRAKAKPKPSPREINIERGLVSAVLNEAFRHGLVDVNEVGRVRPLKEGERDLWLTPLEADQILEHAEEWVQPFILLGAHTGMRRGEICALAWADLDHSPGWIRVDAPKTNTVRFVPVNSMVEAVLEAQTRSRLKVGPSPWVFFNARRRGPYKPDSVYHSFKRAAEAAAVSAEEKGGHERAMRLRKATFHTLRHSFASWLIQAGVPIAEVQQYLGHHSDVMTRRYAHLAPAAKERKNALEVLVSSQNGARVANESCAGEAAVVSS